MSTYEIKSIINRVIADHPETARQITNLLNSFSYMQLEEYARVAKAVMGY